MSRSIKPTFRLKDINLENLDKITIKDKSAGRSYGRRFRVKCDGCKTGDLVFKKVFTKIKSISKQANTTTELKKVKDILSTLRTIEKTSIEGYSDQECGYRFRTWFHRLFTFGSHLDKIETLIEDVSARYETEFEAETEEAKRLDFAQVNNLPLKLSRETNPHPFEKEELITFHEALNPGDVWSSNNHHIRNTNNSFTITNSENKSFSCYFDNGMVSSMRNMDSVVDSIPEEWQIPLRIAFSEWKKSKCVYHSYESRIIKSSLSEFPEWHLREWSKDVPYRIQYRNDNNTRQEGEDAGGLSQDYFSSLVEAVLKETSLFVTLGSSLKLPRIKRDLVSTGIPCCSSAEKQIYQDFGRLLWHSFKKNKLSTGVHFSDALFRGMLSLSSNELTTPFENLPLQTHIKMVRAILEEWENPEIGIDPNDKEFRDVYICLDLLDKDNFNTCMDACTATGDTHTLSKALYAAELYDFMDDFGVVDLTKVKQATPMELRKQFEIGFFKNTNLGLIPQLKGAALGSFLAPIHSMAQGMHAAAGREWATRIANSPISSLSTEIQGISSREAIADKLYTHSWSDEIKTKVSWLQDWIRDETTTDEEVKQFVKFCTGLSNLPKERRIDIRKGAAGALPTAHTCSFAIDIRDTMDETPAGETYPDGSYDKFIGCIKEAIVVTSVDNT